ncbi:MAG TPA: flagellar basal body L-ring protein FlgH [bacterium]|nr:flagellar basal body L-ring protein FlgH [bacterium]
MKRLMIAMLFTIIASAVFVPAVHADSLWNDASESLFSDKRALFVGDLVTIIVNEKTSATQKASTETAQEESLESGTGEGILGKVFEKFGIESSDQYSADGSTSSGSTLSTTISAEVVEVLPNGNLVIEARRSLVVNEETQAMIISGIIRPNDVTRENTVSSSDIANLNVRYQGEGPIAKRQRPGVLNKIFNFIF